MSRLRTFSTTALVLKRSNVGEADRVVTLFTKSHGKLASIAKGVRKIKSSKRAYLEPGNLITAFFAHTKSMPILTQATLIEDCANIHHDFLKIKQLTQVLEIVNSLFVEEEIETELFDQVLAIRRTIVQPQTLPGQVRQQLELLLQQLGYQNLKDSGYTSISEYVSSITERPLKSWQFLSPQNKKQS